ncbi:MAG: RlmE family RNA methyltransferase [Alphaproteobacteria bacterium]|jgi:23S rRNA (uridine2552-2'-O)-methyltransferase|nr:RlmE family RNA methyltransferase [Alphaproteobacteria bacterium]MDP7222133.1 RlmE family RNA methyltransferase [Alphaproteobacteria bacterium]
MSRRKPTRREGTVRVKTARGRKNSSTRWLQRQLNDPYVSEAERLGYRSRAAFKLIEMNEKHDFLRKGMSVIDLGAAPGGWSQVAVQEGARKVIAMDLLEMDQLEDVECIQMDFSDNDAPRVLMEAAGGKVDLVMSDIAPNTIGHKKTDHLRIMALVEMAYDFATDVLAKDGVFIAKVFQGGTSSDLMSMIKRDFAKVKPVKPKASRKESAEEYILAMGFRGHQD